MVALSYESTAKRRRYPLHIKLSHVKLIQKVLLQYVTGKWTYGQTIQFKSFSAELFKVDSSMFKIVRLHFYCNKSSDYFDNQKANNAARYELTHLNQYCVCKNLNITFGAERVKVE